MATKHMLTQGIGLGGSSIFFMVTLGLRAAAALVAGAYNIWYHGRRR